MLFVLICLRINIDAANCHHFEHYSLLSLRSTTLVSLGSTSVSRNILSMFTQQFSLIKHIRDRRIAPLSVSMWKREPIGIYIVICTAL